MDFDFIIKIKKDEDDPENWRYTIKLYASSIKAREEFGDCILATLILDKDEDTLNFLHKKYDTITSSNTVILEYIQRHDDCDKDKKIKNILNLMLCNIIDKLNINIDYVYLFAIHPKLISLYTKYGFKSIDEEDPRNMLAKLTTLADVCYQSPKLYITNV